MVRIKLKCYPFVADFLKKKFGEEISIVSKASEIKVLKAYMREKYDRQYAADQIVDFTAEVVVLFPETFVFANGKVGFRSEAVQCFNSYVRDRLAEQMNDWMDTVLSEVTFQEKEMIFSFLQGKGLHPDNINSSTWAKIRLRHKMKQNGGLLRKKKDRSNVLKNEVMSFANG